jgi:hypothetical protein
MKLNNFIFDLEGKDWNPTSSTQKALKFTNLLSLQHLYARNRRDKKLLVKCHDFK